MLNVIIISLLLAFGLLVIPPVSISFSQIDNQSQVPTDVIIDRKYGPVVANNYIIQLKDSTPEDIQQKADQVNATLKEQGEGGLVDQVYEHALKGFAVKNVEDISIFVGDPMIKTIEPETFDVPHTQYRSAGVVRAGGLTMTGAGYKIDGRESKPNIDIAVIDNRLWIHHPDLNLFRTVDIVPPDQASSRESYHGMHVAGIVAARDNLGGSVGVIPGARIWSISVMNPAGAFSSNILLAFDYITQNAASIEVATMSIGCSGQAAENCPIPSSTNTAITNMVNAGVTFTVSAGNDARNANGFRYCGATSAICVSAMTDNDGRCGGLGGSTDDRRASYSNYGSDVDIMAPGTNILSLSSHTTEPLAPISHTYIGASAHGSYISISGTSMATPFAAGVAAIIKLNNPSFTPAQVKTTLLNDAYSQTQSCSGAKGGLASGANSQSSEKILWAGNY